MNTYHRLIPKKAIRDIEKFKADLDAFAAETGEQFPTLYEDAIKQGGYVTKVVIEKLKVN